MFLLLLLSSSVDARHQPLISPSEAAVLESMMTGGSHLSLKAHFIGELPLLTPLAQTLTSLNLSYNNFQVKSLGISEVHEVLLDWPRGLPTKQSNDVNLRVTS